MSAMHYLEHTETDPAANLAVDDVLLARVEESAEESEPIEVLRVWEPAAAMAVIGRASILASEVNEAECGRRGVPILRRSSGGTAIVTGPGCLMYAVALSLKKRPGLRMIDQAHCFVLKHIAQAVRACGLDAQCAGTSDVMLGGMKFSGNSMRAGREAILYHGTLLLDFDLSLMECLSKNPPRQPEYREGRSHGEFVRNLHLPAERVKEALKNAWEAGAPLENWPRERVEGLVAEKFGKREWTYQR